MSCLNAMAHHALASALPFLLSLERKADEKEALWLRFLLSPASGASGIACSVSTRVSDDSIPYATAIGWRAADREALHEYYTPCECETGTTTNMRWHTHASLLDDHQRLDAERNRSDLASRGSTDANDRRIPLR